MRIGLGLVIAFLTIVSILRLPTALAQPNATILKGLCYDIERSINALVDFTTTGCLPAAGEKKGTVAFILISSKPVFAVASAKKAWLLVVTAAVGKVLNDNPRVRPGEIIVSDVEMMKSKRAFWFSATLAKALQAQVSRDQIGFDQMYSRIAAALKPFVIKKAVREELIA